MKDFKKNTYSDQVVDYVKGLILNGDLVPGDQIREVAISSALSISRAPVREAMQILIREGLIDAHPQKVKNITALTAKQIKNSYFTGGILEAAAVAYAIDHYTEKDIADLECILGEMKDIADKDGPVSKMAPLDNAFHNVLFSKTDNALLIELCSRSCRGLSKFLLYKHWVKLFSAKKVYKRHKEIIDALKTKTPHIVEAVIREHYMTAAKKMSAFGVDVYQG